MGTLPTRWLLFFSSYVPLFIIFAIRYWTTHRAVSAGAISLAVVSAAALALYWKLARDLQSTPATITDVESRSGDAMAYIVTYIIPFLSVDAGARADQASLLMLFFALGVVYVNSNLIHFNPLLSFMGYQLFEARVSGGASRGDVTKVLLTRRSFVRAGDTLQVLTLGDYLVMEE